MTAKESLDKTYKTWRKNETLMQRICRAMKQYAKAKCKEQRSLCIKQLEDAEFYGSYIDVVKEAPEPKFT